MKKAFLIFAFAALALASQAEAAVRWSLKYSYGDHRVNAIITTGDFYDLAGGYPILNISGERDGVPIDGLEHGYDFAPGPSYVLVDTLNPNPNPAFTFLFDNIVFVNGGKAGFDDFGLCYNAGGLEYNVFSNGVTVWELDDANSVATGGEGEVVTNFEIRELHDGCDKDN
jgi:hypothetical protein